MSSNRYVLRVMLVAVVAITMFRNVEGENKAGVLHTLCGTDFTEAWKTCCEGGYPECSNSNGGGGVGALEKKGLPVLSSRAAKNFLGAIRKRSAQDQQAVIEECCYEGCSYGEVAEYTCF